MFIPLSSPLVASKTSTGPLDIKLARSRDELNQAFQLTYRSYIRSGLAADNPSGLRLTPYHLLPSSDVIVAKLRNTVCSTLSVFGDGEQGIPMESMYSREIKTLRDRGLRLAEVGSLADRRAKPSRFASTFAEMARFLAQISAVRNYDALVVAVHPKHARMYKRVIGFKQIGDHTDCPYANGNPAEALYLCFDEMPPRLHHEFFGEPLSYDVLKPYDWNAETRSHFARILECDGKIANTVGLEKHFGWGVDYSNKSLNVVESLNPSTD